jgi:nucleoside-diphosphate-sugar epimerase
VKALVTGGGGFLGEAIVRQLLEAGYTVRSFSRNRHPSLESIDVEIVHGDVSVRQEVYRACEGCDIVFHVAAKAGIWGKYWEYFNANVTGTLNIIEACRSLAIGRLVYTSTPSVVFDGRDMDGADETVPYSSSYKAPYPKTKAIAETAVLAANDAELATVALRPHLIWGPRDSHLIPGILKRGRQGRLFRIGSESKLVDFTYVDNAAEAHVLAAQKLQPGSKAAGKVFFISDGNPIPLWDFVNRVLECGDLQPVNRVLGRRLAYTIATLCEVLYKVFLVQREPPLTCFLVDELVTAHWFDISAAGRLLGYHPRISMEQGLERLTRWLGESSAKLIS